MRRPSWRGEAKTPPCEERGFDRSVRVCDGRGGRRPLPALVGFVTLGLFSLTSRLLLETILAAAWFVAVEVFRAVLDGLDVGHVASPCLVTGSQALRLTAVPTAALHEEFGERRELAKMPQWSGLDTVGWGKNR